MCAEQNNIVKAEVEIAKLLGENSEGEAKTRAEQVTFIDFCPLLNWRRSVFPSVLACSFCCGKTELDSFLLTFIPILEKLPQTIRDLLIIESLDILLPYFDILLSRLTMLSRYPEPIE